MPKSGKKGKGEKNPRKPLSPAELEAQAYSQHNKKGESKESAEQLGNTETGQQIPDSSTETKGAATEGSENLEATKNTIEAEKGRLIDHADAVLREAEKVAGDALSENPPVNVEIKPERERALSLTQEEAASIEATFNEGVSQIQREAEAELTVPSVEEKPETVVPTAESVSAEKISVPEEKPIGTAIYKRKRVPIMGKDDAGNYILKLDVPVGGERNAPIFEKKNVTIGEYDVKGKKYIKEIRLKKPKREAASDAELSKKTAENIADGGLTKSKSNIVAEQQPVSAAETVSVEPAETGVAASVAQPEAVVEPSAASGQPEAITQEPAQTEFQFVDEKDVSQRPTTADTAAEAQDALQINPDNSVSTDELFDFVAKPEESNRDDWRKPGTPPKGVVVTPEEARRIADAEQVIASAKNQNEHELLDDSRFFPGAPRSVLRDRGFNVEADGIKGLPVVEVPTNKESEAVLKKAVEKPNILTETPVAEAAPAVETKISAEAALLAETLRRNPGYEGYRFREFSAPEKAVEAATIIETIDTDYSTYTKRRTFVDRIWRDNVEKVRNWSNRNIGEEGSQWGLWSRSVVRCMNLWDGWKLNGKNDKALKYESKLDETRTKVRELEAENSINLQNREDRSLPLKARQRAARDYNKVFDKLNSLRSGEAKLLTNLKAVEAIKEVKMRDIKERSLVVSEAIEERIRPNVEKLNAAKDVLAEAKIARDEAAGQRIKFQSTLDDLRVRLLTVPKGDKKQVKLMIKECQRALYAHDKKLKQAETGLSSCQENINHLESLLNPWQDLAQAYQDIGKKSVYQSPEKKPAYSSTGETASESWLKAGGSEPEAAERPLALSDKASIAGYLEQLSKSPFIAPPLTAEEINAVAGKNDLKDKIEIGELQKRLTPILSAKGLSARADIIFNSTRYLLKP